PVALQARAPSFSAWAPATHTRRIDLHSSPSRPGRAGLRALVLLGPRRVLALEDFDRGPVEVFLLEVRQGHVRGAVHVHDVVADVDLRVWQRLLVPVDDGAQRILAAARVMSAVLPVGNRA